MAKKLNRRDFVRTTAAAGVAVAAGVPRTVFGHSSTSPRQGPVIMTPKSVKPVVIASANGNGSRTAAARPASRRPSR